MAFFFLQNHVSCWLSVCFWFEAPHVGFLPYVHLISMCLISLICTFHAAGPMGPGQPMPGRMMSGPPSAGPPPGGMPPMMPPRHPGAPNGMCKYK